MLDDIGQYTTEHTQEGCGCSEFGPDPDLLKSIISRGGIPLAKVKLNEDTSEYILEVVTAEPHIPYIAISYVWSHGLGNPEDNRLRLCQLLAIQKAMLPLKMNNTGFWIDTLFIPVKPDYLRKLAIT
jgi:hypothetical protein